MDKKIEFFKELYYKELESKEQLTNRFTTTISLFTLLAAALFFSLQKVNDIKENELIYKLFLVCISITIVIDVVIIILLLFYLFGKTYGYIPRATVLDKYYNELENYHPNQSIADEKFKEYLYEQYVLLADNNFVVNDKRYKTIGNVNFFIILSVITTMLTFACSIPSMFKKDSDVQKVEIIEKSNLETKSLNSGMKLKENAKHDK